MVYLAGNEQNLRCRRKHTKSRVPANHGRFTHPRGSVQTEHVVGRRPVRRSDAARPTRCDCLGTCRGLSFGFGGRHTPGASGCGAALAAEFELQVGGLAIMAATRRRGVECSPLAPLRWRVPPSLRMPAKVRVAGFRRHHQCGDVRWCSRWWPAPDRTTRGTAA